MTRSAANAEEVPVSSSSSNDTVESRLVENAAMTRQLFAVPDDAAKNIPLISADCQMEIRKSVKARDEYAPFLPRPVTTASGGLLEGKTHALELYRPQTALISPTNQQMASSSNGFTGPVYAANVESTATAVDQQGQLIPLAATNVSAYSTSLTLHRDRIHHTPKPKWHPPWKLKRVISGHLGWVRSVAVDPSNEWFATGGGDRLVKIWDLASGTLKISLTGHISTVRAVCISPTHPYLFSAGEDKMVKCWDLETNKVIRHYHGHLSGVWSMGIHPQLDVLVTGSRDSVARVWDMRTRQSVHVLSGHSNTVSAVLVQDAEPQVITASMDSSIRLWDLAAGKTMTTLTHHKKSVRALCNHPTDYAFASASPDNIKQWKFPEGRIMQNLSGHKSIVNALAANDEVMFSGGDNGSMHFWDWKSGYNFQTTTTQVQPGSLESEAGIFCSTFDRSGTRLITGEADKSIKIWCEDESATPESHPINWKPTLKRDHY